MTASDTINLTNDQCFLLVKPDAAGDEAVVREIELMVRESCLTILEKAEKFLSEDDVVGLWPQHCAHDAPISHSLLLAYLVNNRCLCYLVVGESALDGCLALKYRYRKARSLGSIVNALHSPTEPSELQQHLLILRSASTVYSEKYAFTDDQLVSFGGRLGTLSRRALYAQSKNALAQRCSGGSPIGARYSAQIRVQNDTRNTINSAVVSMHEALPWFSLCECIQLVLRIDQDGEVIIPVEEGSANYYVSRLTQRGLTAIAPN